MCITVVFSPVLKNSILATSQRLTNLERTAESHNIPLTPPDVEVEEYLMRVHSREHIERVRNLPFFSTAYESVKCVVKAGDAIKDFDLVMVPTSGTGHSAEKERFRGYSLFNDVAILVEKLKDEGYKRIAVIDTDAHHGNSAAIIGERTLYLCIAGEPECFEEGLLVCKPARDMTREEYVNAFNKTLEILDSYAPEVIVWYFGQDTHFLEYSGMNLNGECYDEMINAALKLAKGRKLIVLLASGSREDVFDQIVKCFITTARKIESE